MQNKDREDNAFPFVMLLVILLGLASLELDEVVHLHQKYTNHKLQN